MLLKYFYDKSLAQASYLLGSSGEALIIDPARDISPYIAAAQAENLTITQVAETHIHADFVSGSRELSAQTGARLYLSAMGGEAWSYRIANTDTVLLRDGASWMLGSLKIDVIHTPGHTPEHLIFQVTDTETTDQPFALFTGDCLFAGDVGRPDLLELAAGVTGTMEQGARDQFTNIQRLKAMPDYLQILPGHGAGSVCGKSLGAIPTSTLGYEKLTNPAFRFSDEAEFVAWLLHDQPEAPPYLAQMKRVNREGAPLLETLEPPQPMEGFILADLLKNGALVIDARAADAQSDGSSVPGALYIPPGDKFSAYAGWFVNYAVPTYLIAAPAQIDVLVIRLRGIGVDEIPGYFTPDELGELTADLPALSPQEAAYDIQRGALPLDVREKSEYDSEHIAGALHIPYGRLKELLASLPQEQPVLIYCGTGIRSQIAASLLLKYGAKDFASLRGGLAAWKQAGLPVTAEKSAS